MRNVGYGRLWWIDADGRFPSILSPTPLRPSIVRSLAPTSYGIDLFYLVKSVTIA
jgi:hypothetical protein